MSYILSITEFPPLVHALRTLREQSFLTIAGWVRGRHWFQYLTLFLLLQTALVEGCYFLFKAILSEHIHGNLTPT